MPWEYIKEYLDELQVEAEWASKDMICEKMDSVMDSVAYIITGAWMEQDDN